LLNRPASVALVMAGLLVGAAIVAAVIGGGLLMEDRHLSRSLSTVPAGHRSIQIAHFGVLPGDQPFARFDARVRHELVGLELEDPLRVVQYKVLRVGGTRVLIAGLDDIERWVRLEHGRMPARCSPRRCEVIIVRGRGRLDPDPEVPIVAVGRGRVASPLPFGRIGTESGETSEALGKRAPATFAIASGAGAVADLPPLQSIYRSYLWIARLRPADVRPWNVDDLARDLDRTHSALRAVSTGFDIASPLAQLQTSSDSGRLAGRRLLLIGGQAAALLLAFAAFAAATMRRDVDATWRRLTWVGARRWQLVLLTVAETAVVAVAAIVLGWLLGAAVTASLAWREESPASEVVLRSLASGPGIAIAVGLCLLATVLIFVALRVGEIPLGGRTLSPIDVAAAGAAVAIFLALSRGEADAESVARSGGTGTFLLLLPGLVLFVVAVGAAPHAIAEAPPARREQRRRSRPARCVVRCPSPGVRGHGDGLSRRQSVPGPVCSPLPVDTRPGDRRSGRLRIPAGLRRPRGPVSRRARLAAERSAPVAISGGRTGHRRCPGFSATRLGLEDRVVDACDASRAARVGDRIARRLAPRFLVIVVA
jgi:hypothetical protein